MVDKEVKIQISTAADTQGAKEAERSIGSLEKEVKKLKEELRATAIGSAQFETLSRQLKNAETELKSVTKTANTAGGGFKLMGPHVQNVSFQLQDFAVQVSGGTSAMRAFSQQAPQLLGFLGPYGALAGAAIAVAPLLIQLFKGGEDGAKKAKESAAEYARALDDFREIYGRFNLVKSIEDDAKAWAEDISKLKEMQDLMQRIRSDETDLAKRRIQSDGNLEIAQMRLNLATVERQLVTATGENAVKLAKERDGVLKQILEKEREIAEKVRAQNEKAALENLKGAQDTATKAQTEADRFRLGQNQSQSKVDDLKKKIEDETKAREESRKAIEDELERRRKSDSFSFGDPAAEINKARIKELQEQRNAIVDKDGNTIKTKEVAQLEIALESSQKELTSATNASNEAAKALAEANNKLATSGFDFAKLLSNQNQDRIQEQRNQVLADQGAAQEKLFKIEDQGAEAVRRLVDSIVADLGQAANSPQNQDRIAAIRQTLADGLQRGEGDPLIAEIQRLVAQVQKDDGTRAQHLNKVTEVMSAFETSHQTALSQLDEIKRRILSLEINQADPNW